MDKELLQAMQATEVKPGMRVRHKASGKEETVITIFKSKEGGKWHDAVLYQGIDSNTGEMATFGRDIGDFLTNFEPAEDTTIADDLPFTGEPFTAKGNEGRNCANCRNYDTDGDLCALWNSPVECAGQGCPDYRE